VLTPEQLRNPKRASGYNYVNTSTPNGGDRTYYQAHGGRTRAGFVWRGTTRTSALQAAQDHCDYVNGSRAASPATPGLKTAAHPKARRKKISPAQQVALDILRDARAKPKSMGWVYLVVEDGTLRTGIPAKVGWTSKSPPEARLNDYQAGNPRKLKMIGKIKGTKRKESNIHKRHIDNNVLGEWFRLTPALLSEFNLKKEDIK
jgi:hypothetical protein